MRSLVALTGLLAASALAQPVSQDRYDCLRWRCIGPFRGGRTVGIDCVWNDPKTWYIGVNNGGVWKSNDYGRTWKSVFDEQSTGSVGCLGIAQSNPRVVYVGSGEGIQRPDLSVGNGIYKTTDGGKSWRNTGLMDGQQVSGICVDPRNENRVFVAVLGHPYGPNATRGVYRTLNGGKSWEKVLGPDINTGAAAVAIDPVNPQIVYADLFAARQGPWENGGWEGPTSGLYKSKDGGKTWMHLTGGLPKDVGRIGFTICKANPRRLYANVDSQTQGGIYRSDDAGQTWRQMNKEPRLWTRGDDFAEVRVDPTNPDIVYSANTSTYRSTDGGVNFACIKGAPGGDDYHTICIPPTHPEIIGIASDQGATISVNSGDTWSTWYNQPTAQFYHVTTDNRFPYWVYGGQQESGSAGVASRGRNGAITFRDWNTVGAEEYAYCAPDPLNPDIIYGNKGTKYHISTGKVEPIRPKFDDIRFIRTMPMIFSKADPHVLFQAAQYLLKTTDGGTTWTKISPDLSREKWDVPASFAGVSDEGKKMKRRGVIYAVGPSPKDVNVIWCGTDDGLVWVTRDGGKNWSNVTPPGVTSWSKVSQIDAGHFDLGTAYVSVNRIRCDDQKPYIYKTNDFGKSWTLVVSGLDAQPVNAVREDPIKPGLLFCSTETQVWFSADDGGQWNSLRMNMPCSSVRDIVVKNDDLVIATHGRSFWICDQINALRQIGSTLYAPSTAYEYENNLNTDTPLPPEEPVGENPPDGICLDYYLSSAAQSVALTIVDSSGKEVRKFDTEHPDKAIDPKTITVDPRWARVPQTLGKSRGAHRFVWDLRLPGTRQGLGMAAIWLSTPTKRGAFVAPGNYRVRLTVDGKTTEVPLTIKPDPQGGTTLPDSGEDKD